MYEDSEKKVEPIIKWAGGKRKLIKDIIPFIPKKIDRYFEPFLGGGSLLFFLTPYKATINDLNNELMNFYEVVKLYPKELIDKLKEFKEKDNEEFYYEVRRKKEILTGNEVENKVYQATRFLYLNKRGFNGLYRVNKKGEFNVPYGKSKNTDIVNESKIIKMSNYFNNNDITFYSKDYKEVVKEAKKGDFIYFDPPYLPISPTSSFISYTSSGFSLNDQKELVEVCKDLKKKGVNFILSNSYSDVTLNLYKDFDVHVVSTRRQISSKSSSRKVVKEILVVSTDN